MSSFQPGIDKSTELTPLTNGVVGEAASTLAKAAEQLPPGELSPRLEPALEALRGDSPTSAGVTTAQKTSLKIAQEMIDSYAFDPKTGVSTFTVPAGVTDVDAMKALNEYFRKNYILLRTLAVYWNDFDWYQNLPNKYPDHCHERDYSGARRITITGLVTGTNYRTRSAQRNVLERQSLVFSDPRDQALAAAIHACKHDGEDLFRGSWVRSSVRGVAIHNNETFGICAVQYGDELAPFFIAASGSTSSEYE